MALWWAPRMQRAQNSLRLIALSSSQEAEAGLPPFSCQQLCQALLTPTTTHTQKQVITTCQRNVLDLFTSTQQRMPIQDPRPHVKDTSKTSHGASFSNTEI